MFSIDGITIKSPSGWKPEWYPLTNSNRVGSGDMIIELVAWKRKFNITYKAIESDELDKIMDILVGSNTMLHTFVYPHNGVLQSAIVYPGALPLELHRGEGAKWVWKNVQFSLIER